MDNYWPVVFIVCAIALAVGPVMMMQPSSRSRRLSELRQAAAQKTMRVRLSMVNVASSKTEVAVYSLSLPKTDTMRPRWTLLKQDYTHDLNFYDLWDWDNKKHIAPESQHTVLRELLASLDSSVVGIEMNQSSVGVYWCEKTLSIEDIESLLIRCKETVA